MFADYFDFKNAFDSLYQETPWAFLHLCGIPARIIGLLIGHYSMTKRAVKYGVGVPSFFPVRLQY